MEAERIDRLDAMIAGDRLLRRKWTDGQGRACLLAALSPEVGEAESAFACPSSVMPAWLAELTPAMDDNGSAGAWPVMVRRYAALARRWHVLSPEAWERCDVRCKLASLAVARENADERGREAIDDVVVLLERRIVGGSSAETAAYAAAARWSEAETAAYVKAEDRAAARVYAAAAAAAYTAAAYTAARVATWAARAEEWSWAWAWDRITAATLDAIEAECALAH